jgi:hypothetical protein
VSCVTCLIRRNFMLGLPVIRRYPAERSHRDD